MKNMLYKSVLCAAVAMLFACSDDAPSQKKNLEDAGVTDTRGADTQTPDSTSLDASDTVEPDASTPDAGADANDPSNGRTLSDYRRCQSNLDCPVGLGVCVNEVTLNRANAAGESSVPISDIFPELAANEGICTLVCTSSPDVCGSLSTNGIEADAKPHTCQLVTTAEAPYPAALPAFPFDSELNPIQQSQGQPFGAICRAPFGLDPDVSDAFCESCEGPDSCGDGASLCWSAQTDAAAQAGESGLCLTPCDGDDTCPMGFACDASDADGQSYCRPQLGTCTACQDRDQDGFGTGRCGSDESPVTAHDCDDQNAQAYYDPDNMEHAFPATCGEQDFNCNGLSDAVEQISAADYPEEHCGGCFDACAGAVDNGQKFCQQGDAAGVGACAAQCETDAAGVMLFADCDGDLSNGCEVAADDESRQYYRDADGDGFGDPNDRMFDCGNSGAPVGYVSNADDCDDTSSDAYGGDSPGIEWCDGLDNDCNGEVDDNPNDAALGLNCADSGYVGACKPGYNICEGGQIVCAPEIEPDTQPETCDTPDVDDDCDGSLFSTETVDYYRYYRDNDGDNYGSGVKLSCSSQTPDGYSRNFGDCDDDEPAAHPGRAEVCDGIDNNCSGNIDGDGISGSHQWFEDADSDGLGDPNTATDPQGQCDAPTSFTNPVTVGGDCDDNNNTIGVAKAYYLDDDGDGYGQSGESITSCTPSFGYSEAGGDCNDLTATTQYISPAKIGSKFSPANQEVCDGQDNDCDGATDEGCPSLGLISWDGDPGFAEFEPMGNPTFVPSETHWGDKITGCYEGKVWSAVKVNYYPDSYPVVWIEPGCQIMTASDSSPEPANPYHINLFDMVSKFDDNGDDPDYGDVSFQNVHPYVTGTAESTYFCPKNSAIYKVEIGYKNIVDSIKFYCRDYKVGTQAGGFEITGGFDFQDQKYGGNGEHTDAQECGDGQVAVGARVQSKVYYNRWSMGRLNLRCVDLKLY